MRKTLFTILVLSGQICMQAQNMKARKGARSQEIAGAYELWQKSKAGKRWMKGE